MSLANDALNAAAQEYAISKDKGEEFYGICIEGIFSQIIRLYCYSKGLEYALEQLKYNVIIEKK